MEHVNDTSVLLLTLLQQIRLGVMDVRQMCGGLTVPDDLWLLADWVLEGEEWVARNAEWVLTHCTDEDVMCCKDIRID